jgi:hypothetical protein
MLDAGLYPFTLPESAMAEFYPADAPGIVCPSSSVDQDILRALTCTEDDFARIREHSVAHSDPKRFAESYTNPARRIILKTPVARRSHTRSGSDVSVLIPFYNNQSTIQQTLGSVVAQTVLPREIVLLDDGSEAGATQDFSVSSSVVPCRILRSPVNEGLCATRNKLINASETHLSIFLDADDLFEPTFVERTLKAYNSSPEQPSAVFALKRNFGVSEDPELFFGLDDHSFFFDNNLRMTALIETAVLSELRFDPSMRNGEADDWDFWLRYQNRGYRATCVPEHLFLYRHHEGSMSWPWSAGQRALTGSLLARQLCAAATNLPPVFYSDLAALILQPGASDLTGRSLGARLNHIAAIKHKHPRTAAVLEALVRLVTGTAKRLR